MFLFRSDLKIGASLKSIRKITLVQRYRTEGPSPILSIGSLFPIDVSAVLSQGIVEIFEVLAIVPHAIGRAGKAGLAGFSDTASVICPAKYSSMVRTSKSERVRDDWVRILFQPSRTMIRIFAFSTRAVTVFQPALRSASRATRGEDRRRESYPVDSLLSSLMRGTFYGFVALQCGFPGGFMRNDWVWIIFTQSDPGGFQSERRGLKGGMN